ncbi:hypothetical protein EROM_011090 [Encephalitozoon romaleae SJ-2008]|uniref:Uncharacterized protein n=2 Tax=Encephalitozoon romaleae TaxID=571949 RepID=I6ZGY8_ENCRO|nr:hypothetical protein EROM_011090 [Encephalitozoon romaleae SJ-2008]AEI16587.1 hypothetical protein 011325900051 [Encephalitozoon romaleae]AFN82453.1 hypothetical protein EROM_011090 [Encephalitozoon romaleae SJ-2008]
MVRKSLYILAVAGVGIIRAGGLYIPSNVLQDLGKSSNNGCLMIAEVGGNFSVVASGEPVYITEQAGHSEVVWQPVAGENRAVPVYAPTAEEIRESIPSAAGIAPTQYIPPQQGGFVPSSTPVFVAVEEVGPSNGTVVSSTSETCGPKTAGATTGAAAGTTGDKSKAGAAGTTGDKSKNNTSSSKKKKGAKSLMAFGAVVTTALFSIL